MASEEEESCYDELSDPEILSRLLQEKEKDLELAAKIGQELLERNKLLDSRIQQLEIQVSSANELMTQLRYELQVKSDLLRAYSEDEIAFKDSLSHLELNKVSLESMSKRIQELEDENQRLHEEADILAKEAIEVEEKEERLVSQAAKNLSEANAQIRSLSEECSKRSRDHLRQREEINYLQEQLNVSQARSRDFEDENVELRTNMEVYRQTNEEMTNEVKFFKEKYFEVLNILNSRNDNNEHCFISPDISSSNLSCSTCNCKKQDLAYTSLQFEIRSTIHKGSTQCQKNQSRRSRSRLSSTCSQFSSNPSTLTRPTTGDSGVISGNFNELNKTLPSGDDQPLHGHDSTDFHSGSFTPINESPVKHALETLSTEDIEKRRQSLKPGHSLDLGSDGYDTPGSLAGQPGFHFLPYGVHTPRSEMSSESEYFSELCGKSSETSSRSGWKLNEKLKIMKPLEGSLTLSKWHDLAMPDLGNALKEHASGVTLRGGINENAPTNNNQCECSRKSSLETKESRKVLLVKNRTNVVRKNIAEKKGTRMSLSNVGLVEVLKRHQIQGFKSAEVLTLQRTESEPSSLEDLNALKDRSNIAISQTFNSSLGSSQFESFRTVINCEVDQKTERSIQTDHDLDELEEIEPGTLTSSGEPSPEHKASQSGIGQLTPPILLRYSRPSLALWDLGNVPTHQEKSPLHVDTHTYLDFAGLGKARYGLPPCDTKPKINSKLGVPGTPGTGAVNHRSDLGSVPRLQKPSSESNGIIGCISNLFFGRKGGLL